MLAIEYVLFPSPHNVKCDSCSRVIEAGDINCHVEVSEQMIPTINLYAHHIGCWREKITVLRKHDILVRETSVGAIQETVKILEKTYGEGNIKICMALCARV